nr:MAG TPA: hypothetical protein [Microviridae sp.]
MNKKCTCRFGHGYRALDREECFSAKCFNPAVVEGEVTLEVDNVDLFRIEEVTHTDPSESYIRIRSDVSMLFHAESTAKKIGVEGFRYLAESRRVKSSPTQSMMDNIPDDLILDTLKSRHLQQPSELLAFSEQLSALASDMEEEYKAYVESQTVENNESSQQTQVDGTSPSSAPSGQAAAQ